MSCQLTEVTIPLGEPVVVIHAVLSRGAVRQFVLVEESLTGATLPEGRITPDSIPPGGSPRPIRGATVVLTYGLGTACGPAADTLPPLPGADGVYQREGLCTPAPGDVIDLVVRTPDGQLVTGRTTMAGARRIFAAVGTDTVTTPSAEIVLNRDRDTVRVGVDPIVGRAIQVEVRRPDAPRHRELFSQGELVFYLVRGAFSLALPGTLVNPFEGDDGEVIFRPGIGYDLTVAITDTAYHDFVRSRNDPFTGRGFINRLDGGIGVFGSVEPRTWRLKVVAEVDQPREGRYRLQGALAGVPVDVTLELYLDPLSQGVFAAFIEGQWHGGPIRRSLDGVFSDRTGEPERFDALFEIPRAGAELPDQWTLQGRRAPQGQGFQVTVIGVPSQGTTTIRGTLTAEQLSGPAR